jgi:hypothetical protein
MTAIEWYQTKTHYDPVVCWHDGIKLVGRCHIGHVHLECPHCGYRLYEFPLHVIELYFKENDIPTIWRIEEAKVLAEKLGRSIPESVMGSAMQLEQYIKATRGKVLAFGEKDGNCS